MSLVLLDMDGVLVDFIGPAMELHGSEFVPEEWPAGEWNIEKVLGVSTSEFWRRIDQAAVHGDWWRYLPRYEWFVDLLDLMPGRDWHIATSPSRHPKSHHGKVNWLLDQFGEGFRRYMLGPDKWLMAHPDRILIDDGEHNVDAFRMHGGKAILFPQPWNSNRSLCDRRIEYVAEQLEELLA